jgi:hypothetical protein
VSFNPVSFPPFSISHILGVVMGYFRVRSSPLHPWWIGTKRLVANINDVCLDRMIQIMQIMSEGDHGSNTARTRVQVLSEFLVYEGRV